VRAVNLLPRDDASQNGKIPPLPVLVGCVGAVLVAAVLAFAYLSASGGVATKQHALEDAQAQLAAIPAPTAPPAVVSQLPQERRARVTALSTVLGQRVNWDRLLREMSQVVPNDVWLTAMNALAPSAAAPTDPNAATTPQGFTVTGCTYSQDSVARFLARLAIVPDLAGITLQRSSSGGGGSTTGGGVCPADMVTFTLQGGVRTAGAS
jgi:Tfp pilus assembly protein PilN